MAYKEVAFVLFVCSCFLGWASATKCVDPGADANGCDDSDSCCSDGVCRESCHFCSYSWQCGPGECCTSSGSCTTPCSDGDCREVCYCSSSSQCGSGECCDSGRCKVHCSIPGGVIAGIVVICCLLVAAIVVSIVAYFYWECCPCYRYHLRHRHPGQFVRGAQPMGMTTTVATQQNIQHPTPAGYNPPPAEYNSSPASGYTRLKDYP